MEAKVKGQEHGATVRRAAAFAVGIVVALGKDMALNARRGGSYASGFLDGLRRPETHRPNA